MHDRRTSASASAAPATRRRPTRPRRASATAVRRTAATPGAGPTETLTFSTPQPQPGGVRPRVLDPGPRRPLGRIVAARGATTGTAVPLPGPSTSHRAFVFQEYDRGLRRARAGPRRSRARRCSARSATSSRALPQRPRAARPGAHDAPARGEVQPRVRRRLPRRLHPRGRLRRARARSSPTPGSAAPDSVGAWPYHDHGPNHTLNTFRGLFGAIVVREKGERRRTSRVALPPRAAAAGHRPAPAVPVHQRPGLRGQHADDQGEGRPGRRAARLRDGQQLPRLPHPRPPLEGRGGAFVDTPVGRAQRDDRPSASSRTTPAAGCTTATSSPTRTAGWRAGTSSSPSRTGESPCPIPVDASRPRRHRRRRPGGPGRGRRGRLPAADQPDRRAAEAQRSVPHAEGLQAKKRPRAATGRSRRPSTRPTPATRSRSRTAPTARREDLRRQEALPQAHRQPEGTRRRSSSTARA